MTPCWGELLTPDRVTSGPNSQHFEVPHLLSPADTGREEAGRSLESSLILAQLPHQPVQRRFVLWGLGGSGKTQICLKYAQAHRERYASCRRSG